MRRTYELNEKEVTFILCSAVSCDFPELGRRKCVYVHQEDDEYRDGDFVIFSWEDVPADEQEAYNLLEESKYCADSSQDTLETVEFLLSFDSLDDMIEHLLDDVLNERFDFITFRTGISDWIINDYFIDSRTAEKYTIITKKHHDNTITQIVECGHSIYLDIPENPTYSTDFPEDYMEYFEQVGSKSLVIDMNTFCEFVRSR